MLQHPLTAHGVGPGGPERDGFLPDAGFVGVSHRSRAVGRPDTTLAFMTSFRPLAVAATAATILLSALPAVAQTPAATPSAGIDLSRTQWGMTAVRANEAWKTTKGAGVTVAVLDTGVDATHPDLIGRVLPGWSSYYGRALPAGVDNDPGAHGTHVAAIIAGDADGDGISGVAPEATILPVQVLGSSGGTDANVADGIDWAIAQGADVINMSLGGSKNIFDKGGNLSCAAVGRAFEAGVVVVVSAGNSGGEGNPENRPASCRGALSVAALDENLDRTFFSSFDATVALAAPGRRIVSAVPNSSGFPYDVWDGTSMAAPFVSGVAALILAANPDWTVDQVTQRLRESAVDLGAPGVDPETGHGLVDAAAAIGLGSRDATAARRAVRSVAVPRITFAVSNRLTTTVRWEAPIGTAVTSYLIRHTDTNGIVAEETVPGDQLEGEVLADAWIGGRLVVIAQTDNGERESFPFGSVDIDFPDLETPELPTVTKASGRWVKSGLEVSFSTTGPSGEVNLTLIDWEYGLAGEVYVDSKARKAVIPVPLTSELRAHHGIVVIGNDAKRIRIEIAPQFLVSGTVLTAGKGRIAVKGTTINACFSHKVGCQGALVEIVDGRSGAKLANARVLENLTFAAVFNRRPGVEMVVVINGRYRTPALLVPSEGVRP